MSPKAVTIVPTRSSDGIAFAEAASDIAAACGYEVRVLFTPTKHNVWKAAWGTGAVVFDATIEPGGDHNYASADYYLLMSPYNIVVSRSYLPVNFRGHLNPIAPPYPHRLTNEQLLEATKRRLEALIPRLPKPPQTMAHLEEDFDIAHEEVNHEQSDTFDVFLSYRGSYVNAASDLADAVGRTQGKRVQIIRTDDLSYLDEVLTLQRRWQILRRIYALMLTAHEVWVLWSDDYLDSWWTQGELVSFAYMSDDARRASLRVFHADDTGEPSPEHLLPHLSPCQEDAITRRFILSNVPESLPRIRTLLRRPLARMLLGLADDPMLAPSFSEDAMLECHVCKRRRPSVSKLDVGSFLDGDQSSLRAIPDDELTRSLVSGELHCPGCSSRYLISSGPPRYWWYPVRSRGPAGPRGMQEHTLCRARLESQR
jgi:hypothetical protein